MPENPRPCTRTCRRTEVFPSDDAEALCAPRLSARRLGGGKRIPAPGASLLSPPPACRQLLSCVSFGMGNDIKRAFWEERNPILSNATRLRGRQTWGVNDWINTESQPPGREAAECAGPRPPPAGGGAFLTYAAADGNNSRQLTPFFFFFLPRWRLADSDLNPGGLWPRPGTRPRWSRNCTCP